MSQDGHIPPGFSEWIVHSLDGTITPEQFALLDHEIVTNGAARAYYLEFVTTYVGLVDLAGVLPKAIDFVPKRTPPDANKHSELTGAAPPVTEYRSPGTPKDAGGGAVRLAPEASEDDKARRIERYAREQLEAFLAQQRQDCLGQESQAYGWDLFGAADGVVRTARWLASAGVRTARTVAVCSLAAAFLLMTCLYFYSHRTVATLVESLDAKWDVDIPPDGKLRPRYMTLEQGYARITLKRGADVILQAPTTFEVQTRNRMFLEGGWITAKVPAEATGFTVRTPASSVVDFGTEFGLLVGAESSAEIHVFKGEIGLQSKGATGSNTPQRFEEGEAATVDVSGRVDRNTVSSRPRLFVRAMPTGGGFGIPGKRLSLADIVGGGNGLGTGVLQQSIDPSTGAITSGREILEGADNGFQQVPSLPFVDGVFVPDSNDGSAIVTSTGISFEQCPQTCGLPYEAIIDGAVFQVGSSGEVHDGRLAGRTYGTKANPSIGMHPNAGITFDLDAIRSAMPEAQIRQFRARCGVSENVVPFAERDADPNMIAVTFWVLVDGRPRSSQTLGVVPAQTQSIDVPIGPRDRFLTLATSNPGEYRYCWAMFAEAALELTTGDEATVNADMR